MRKPLCKLRVGAKGKVIKLGGKSSFRKRIREMGLIPGSEIEIIRVAPLGDPVEIKVRGYLLSLRKAEIEGIEVEVEE